MAQKPDGGTLILAPLSEWTLGPGTKSMPSVHKKRLVAVIYDSINYAVGTQSESGQIICHKFSCDFTRIPYMARAYDASIDVVAAARALIEGVSALTGEIFEQTGNIDNDLVAVSDRIVGHLLSENNFAQRMIGKNKEGQS